MLLWLLIAAMTGAAALLLLWPLARARSAAAARAPDDAAFYRATLADLDHDAARGLIGAEEATAARTEAARRLLRSEADARQTGLTADDRARRIAASLLALIAVPAIALGAYGLTGSPALPDQPLAARRSSDPAQLDVGQAVARIEAHLSRNPNDGPGFEVIAPVYLRMGRLDDAVRAFSASVRLNGETPERLANFGEALAARAGGIVSAEARERFQRALALDQSQPKARYYLALAAEQDGDKAAAVAAYEALVTDAPAGAPWLEMVRERLAVLRNVPAGGESIAALPDEQRRAAIRGMVEGLAQRLATNGGGLDDWSRLIRSRMVLQERDKAADALAGARRALPDAGAALDALAREIGLN